MYKIIPASQVDNPEWRAKIEEAFYRVVREEILLAKKGNKGELRTTPHSFTKVVFNPDTGDVAIANNNKRELWKSGYIDVYYGVYLKEIEKRLLKDGYRIGYKPDVKFDWCTPHFIVWDDNIKIVPLYAEATSNTTSNNNNNTKKENTTMPIIIPAKDLNPIPPEMIADEFCRRLMEQIKKKNMKGERVTVFYVSPFYVNRDTKEFYSYSNSEILHDVNGKYTYCHFDNYCDIVKQKFIAAGYKIRPTGVVGGVRQLTEDILW